MSPVSPYDTPRHTFLQAFAAKRFVELQFVLAVLTLNVDLRDV